MIGGYDITISGILNPIVKTCEAIATTWPDAVVKDESTGTTVLIAESAKLSASSEIFIYRNQAAKDAWTKHGACEKTADTMIHIICEKDRVTFVVDSLDGILEIAMKGCKK